MNIKFSVAAAHQFMRGFLCNFEMSHYQFNSLHRWSQFIANLVTVMIHSMIFLRSTIPIERRRGSFFQVVVTNVIKLKICWLGQPIVPKLRCKPNDSILYILLSIPFFVKQRKFLLLSLLMASYVLLVNCFLLSILFWKTIKCSSLYLEEKLTLSALG